MAGEKAHIKIRIGAAQDASVAAVFKSIEKRAEMAAKAIGGSAKKGALIAEKEAQRGAKAADKAASLEIAASERATEAKIKAAERAARASERAAAIIARAHARAEAQSQRAAERTTAVRTREASKQAGEVERAEARAARVRDRFATRTSHRATRFFMPNAPIGSLARRVGSDMLRGAGVDLSLGGALGRNMAIESQASQLATAGYIPGKEGPNGARQSPKELESEARALSKAKGLPGGTEAALGAAQAFVTKTGELDTARGLMAEMADLAIATQTSLEDMVDAAGDVSNNLGDVPDKAAKISLIMRTVAAQGKIGSVEIKDLASRMATLAAAAKQFEGDPGENITKMGTLAQIARKYGGADSAPQAATAIRGFANTLATPARVAQFKAHDVNIFDKETQNFRDPIQILRESLVASGGDPLKLKKMFMNVKGAQVVQGLANEYRSAGGAKDSSKGLAAVDKIIRDNQPAALDAKFIEDGLKAHLETGAAKAIKAQEAWDGALTKMRDTFVSKVDPILPKLEEFAATLGDVTTWVVDNPKAAIGSALTLAIGRAGIESVFRASIEKAILGSAGNFTTPGGAGKPGGLLAPSAVLGNIATIAVATMTIGTASFTAVELGMQAIDDYFKKRRDGENDDIVNDVHGAARRTKFETEITKGNLPDAERGLRLEREALEMEGKRAGWKPTDLTTEDYDPLGFGSGRNAQAEKLDSINAELARLTGLLSAAQNRVQQVEVINPFTPSKLEPEKGNYGW